MNPILKGYLRLTRPANLPTAAADIMAGTAIAGIFPLIYSPSFWSSGMVLDLLYLILSSVCLYAAGVVLNDVFDVGIDRVERPERPIPSGLISVKAASVFGSFLLLLGIISAFFVNSLCGGIAMILALSIVLYDSFSKKHTLLGPLNMGICRALNLLLGMAIVGGLGQWWYVFIPLIYIFAITLISRGEVHGNNKKHIIFAGILYAIVILTVITLLFFNSSNMLNVIPFLTFFAILVYRPLYRAYNTNSPENIKRAVIAGVLSLIVLDASIAVGFSHFSIGLLIVLLLPLSILLSKLFAVT
ncbi:MAG: UbiA-like protein EboC [Saonia sp.]